MTDFNFHLNQLPNFLQAEVHATAGATGGLPYDQIIARYRSAAEHLIAVKRARYQPTPGPLTKAQVDDMMSLVTMPGADFSKAFHFQLMLAQIGYESIRFLTVFNNSLIAVQAQLNEAARQLALRQAQEAAQRLAQQQAEATARLVAQTQAEEAARLLIQRQAEEAARLLAQQQAEEAARQLAQQQAEAAALLLAQRQAEEVARLLAQREAEEAARLLAQQQAEEAARQVAQRQAEEAQLAQRQAEESALLVIRPQVEQAVIRQIIERAKDDALQPAKLGEVDASTLAEFEGAASKLESDVKVALADFTNATSLDTGVSATDAFSAMLYAFKQTGVDVEAACDGVRR
jgi:DNA segregation ATPase FtsK/SpoIIIE-like protein